MTGNLKEAKRSIEIAYLLSQKVGARDDEARQEIREWLETAQAEIDMALDELDTIDEHRERRDQ